MRVFPEGGVLVKVVSIKNNYEFRRMYAKAKHTVSPYFVVYSRKNAYGVNRLGITASTKLGHAVIRNRVRRRIREIYRTNQDRMVRGYDVVVVARSKSVDAAFGVLQADLCRQLVKHGLMEKQTI